MSHLPIDFFRQHRVNPHQGTRISARTFGLVLMTLLAVCSLGASAQVPTYTLTTNGPISVKTGHFAPFKVTVTPTSNINGTVSIGCTNLPANAFCELPNASGALAVANTPASLTININTSQVYNYETRSAPRHSTMGRVVLCSLFAPALGLLLLGRKRGLAGNTALRVMVFVLALCPMLGLAGCSNSQPQFTPVGAYTILISGSYANVIYSTPMVVNVTQ